MNNPEEFVKELRNIILTGAPEGPVYCKNIDCIYAEMAKHVRARDAEWQAMVDRAVDEAVSESRKVAQASEDYRNLMTMIKSIHIKLEDCDHAAAEEIARDALRME